MTVDVVASRGTQKHRRSRKISRFPPAARWNAVENLPATDWIIPQRLRVVRRHVTGRDSVHVDPFRRPLISECSRELRHATFRRRVSRHQNSALEGKHGRDIQNFSARSLLEHLTCGKL